MPTLANRDRATAIVIDRLLETNGIAAPTSNGQRKLDLTRGRSPMGSHSALPDTSERLALDAALCEQLRAIGCKGTDWERFASAIYRKAVKTTWRLITDGEMFFRCRKQRRPVDPIDISRWPPDDIKALATEAVEDNFPLFRKVGILGGDWDPSKGASLHTYFIGGVTLCFPNAIRRFCNQNRWHHTVTLVDEWEPFDQIDEQNYSNSLARCFELLATLLDAITGSDQRMVAEMYFIDALSVKQIAAQLGVTDATVRGRLKRAKQAMRHKHRIEEGGL